MPNTNRPERLPSYVASELDHAYRQLSDPKRVNSNRPRKVHFLARACARYAEILCYAPATRLHTENREEVTCKTCLRLLAQS